MFRTHAALAALAIAACGMAVAPLASAYGQAAQSPAASRPADPIDAIVRSGMETGHISGLSLTVLRGGKVIRQSGYGFANLEHRIPVTAQTAFNIGSLSKQIIASGVMLLVQERKIDLDASISLYIEDVPAHWRPITIRHLLTHTSGLVREAPGFAPEADKSVMDVVRTAFPLPLLFQPGEKFEYCNTGYFILAELIERTAGVPWQAFFQDRFFRPLGMTATRPTSRVDIVSGRAAGYQWKDDRFENVMQYRALRPSGAFVSTASDLAKWEKSLVDSRLLSKQSLGQMWTKARLNNGQDAPYGFGWRLEQVNGALEIGHAGSLPGFRAYYARYPAQDLTVIALINVNDNSTEPTAIVRAVAKELIAAGSRN